MCIRDRNRDIRAANSLMQSIRSAIRGLQRWIADLNEKKQLLLDALEKAKEPTLSDLLVDYFNLRNEQRSDWSSRAQIKCTARDLAEVMQAVDYLKAHSLNTVEDLNQAIDKMCIRDRCGSENGGDDTCNHLCSSAFGFAVFACQYDIINTFILAGENWSKHDDNRKSKRDKNPHHVSAGGKPTIHIRIVTATAREITEVEKAED